MSRITRMLVAGGVGLVAVGGLARPADAAFVANPSVTASATPFNASFPATNVFDGSGNDYASQGQGVNTFIDFDFGAATTVDGFDIVNRVTGHADKATTFDLIFSANPTFGDAGDTTVTISPSYVGAGTNVHTGSFAAFAPQTARYVRWDVTSNAGATSNNLGAAEMRFRSAGTSTRLAPNAVTVINAATAFSAQYPAANASDGRVGNGAGDYAGAQGTNTFVDFDLGSTQPVNGFELMQRIAPTDRATAFDVLFSNDPTFATGVTTRNYTNSSLAFSDAFAPVNARYVRWDVTAGSGNIGMQEMSFTVVPEPATAGVLAAAAAGLLARRRRRTA